MAKKFTEKQKEILARKLGYEGPMNMFEQFVKSDPAMERKYNTVSTKYMARGGAVKKYNTGGVVKMAEGGSPQPPAPPAVRVDMSWFNNPSLQNEPSFQKGVQTYGSVQNFKNALEKYERDLALYNVAWAEANATGTNPEGFLVSPYEQAANSPYLTSQERTKYKDLAAQYKTIAEQKDIAAAKENEAYGLTVLRGQQFNDTERALQEKSFSNLMDRKNKISTAYQKLREQLKNNPQLKQNPAALKNALDSTDYYWELDDALAQEDYLKNIDHIAELRNKIRAGSVEVGSITKDTPLPFGNPYGSFSLDTANQFIPAMQEADAQAAGTSAQTQAALQSTPTGGATGTGTMDEAALKAALNPFPAGTPGQQTSSSTVSTGPVPDWVVPPPFGSAAPAVVTTLTNPITGEKFVAPSGGYTLREDLAGITPTTPARSLIGELPTTPTTGSTTPTGTTQTGVASGTTATTTAPVGGTAETTATTTAAPTTMPTTGVQGTQGVQTVQTGSIPTTSTVPKVNIPQVTAATVPTEPGQIVAPTGAPEQAAQIQAATVPGVAQVTPTTPQAAATMEATTATGAVSGELAGLQPEQGAVSEQAKVTPVTMEPTSTALAGLQAAQTTAGQVQGAPTREVVAGELIEGPTVDRAAVEAALAQNEAAQGVVTEDMTVQGQLAKLTTNFEATNPPSWAAGALRNATAVMAQRGLAASSLAGQALIQATIEAALPIASADAQIYREMGIQNLSNKQQMAVLSAQQRAAFLGQEFDQAFQTRVTNAATISEIANLNFSAKQQIALENARLAESVNLANLNNRQALVMANAAQIATLETTNLNNRQQANVLNAQAFLQMDLTNLSNRQQTALFKSQSMIQSILSDQAAENAARQFNASSINQVNQFYDGLTAQIKQFNATQANAMNQFNVSQINSVAEFNASQQNARDQFNAEYRRIIDQSNAEWRRNIALADTAAINRANEVNATAALGISTIEYNNLWQTYRDNIEYAWKTGENALDRENELARQVLAKQATIEAAKFQIEAAKYQALGSLAAQVFDKGGIAAGVGSVIMGAAGSIATGIKNAVSASATGFSVLPNNAKPGDAQYGWTYTTDGTNKIDIAPDGSTFYNGVLQDYNYGYGSSGYGWDTGAGDSTSGDIDWDLWSGGG